MRKYMIERTDGKIDHIEADKNYVRVIDEVAYFYNSTDDTVYTYAWSNIIRIVDLGEVKEDEESEEPERRKNDNEDLISRSKLLNFLSTHWSSNVIEVIKSFEKAEFLD